MPQRWKVRQNCPVFLEFGRSVVGVALKQVDPKRGQRPEVPKLAGDVDVSAAKSRQQFFVWSVMVRVGAEGTSVTQDSRDSSAESATYFAAQCLLIVADFTFQAGIQLDILQMLKPENPNRLPQPNS